MLSYARWGGVAVGNRDRNRNKNRIACSVLFCSVRLYIRNSGQARPGL